MRFDVSRLPLLMRTSCIPYGQVPADAEATPAAPLQTGKAYSVYLNARTSDASDPTRGRYFTKCCLAADVADAANSRRVAPLVPGTRAWWDEACD